MVILSTWILKWRLIICIIFVSIIYRVLQVFLGSNWQFVTDYFRSSIFIYTWIHFIYISLTECFYKYTITCMSKAHCGYTSFHKYVITISVALWKWLLSHILKNCKKQVFWMCPELKQSKKFSYGNPVTFICDWTSHKKCE